MHRNPNATGQRHRPLRHALRYPAATLLVAAGAFHIPVIPGHLEEAPYIGALFIALTVVCFALALALPRWDTPALWAATVLVTAAAVAAYVLSRCIALPQIADDVGNWTEPLGLASITSEALTTALATAALLAQRQHTSRMLPTDTAATSDAGLRN